MKDPAGGEGGVKVLVDKSAAKAENTLTNRDPPNISPVRLQTVPKTTEVEEPNGATCGWGASKKLVREPPKRVCVHL